MASEMRGGKRLTTAADKNFDTRDSVRRLRQLRITPRVARLRTSPPPHASIIPPHARGNPAYNRAMGRTEAHSAGAAVIFSISLAVHARPSPQDSRPIPPIASLMKEVLANQDGVDRLRESYSCTDTRTVRNLGKHGRVKKTETYVYQVSFFGPLEVDRLIEKNGRPLGARAQKKEDERVANEIKKYEKKTGGDAEATAKEKQRAALTIQNFLRADLFVHPRRESRTGEELIVFDFSRNPNYKPRNLMEKVAQALAGTIWIDEKAHEVTQLDAHVENDIKVGDGLVASLHRGSAVSFVQTLVDGQVWLPTHISARISVRALLLFGLNLDQTDSYSAYQKFHVNVRSTVAPPAPSRPQRCNPGERQRTYADHPE